MKLMTLIVGILSLSALSYAGKTYQYSSKSAQELAESIVSHIGGSARSMKYQIVLISDGGASSTKSSDYSLHISKSGAWWSATIIMFRESDSENDESSSGEAKGDYLIDGRWLNFTGETSTYVDGKGREHLVIYLKEVNGSYMKSSRCGYGYKDDRGVTIRCPDL